MREAYGGVAADSPNSDRSATDLVWHYLVTRLAAEMRRNDAAGTA